MPLQIVHNDITKVSCEAIVNPTDSKFSGRGGADLAIHKAAGKKLTEELFTRDPIDVGQVAVTGGYDLNCNYIIHTVGPRWKGGKENEIEKLTNTYIAVLDKATELGITSIAFPLISSGTFGFPKNKVLLLAMEAISSYLETSNDDMDVLICIYDKSAFETDTDYGFEEFIGERKPERNKEFTLRSSCKFSEDIETDLCEESVLCSESMQIMGNLPLDEDMSPKAAMPSLSEWLKKQDATFSDTLYKLIDKSGMTDVETYKKANVSRKTFSKIHNEEGYRPSKQTVLCFAIALKLNLEETEALLKTVGFALSDSNKGDLIVKYYIMNEDYNIMNINMKLFEYDQVLLFS